EKRAEALAGRAGEVDPDGVVGETLGAVAPGDLAAQHRANRSMLIANRQLDFGWRLGFDGVLGQVDDLVIESLAQTVILRLDAAAGDARRHYRIIQNVGKI